MRIRCTSCRKKISIDDAFAGGVCRCPYCKETVFVPGSMSDSVRQERPEAPTAARPEAPPVVRPEAPPTARPETPPGQPAPAAEAAAAPAEAAASAHAAPHHIPVARPVMIQGIVAIVLTVLLIGMIAGTVVLMMTILTPPKQPTGPQAGGGGTTPVAPDANNVDLLQAGQRQFAGMSIQPPVVYCLDNGTPWMLSPSKVAALVSIEALNRNDLFSVVLCGGPQEGVEGIRVLPEGYRYADEGGRNAVKEFFNISDWRADESDIAGAVDLALALDPAPKTIVICSAVSPRDPKAIGEKIKAAGAKAVVLAVGAFAADDLRQLAEASGGEFLSMNRTKLEGMTH